MKKTNEVQVLRIRLRELPTSTQQDSHQSGCNESCTSKAFALNSEGDGPKMSPEDRILEKKWIKMRKRTSDFMECLPLTLTRTSMTTSLESVI